MRIGRFWKLLLLSSLLFFILLNTVAFFHAYKFTHFDETDRGKTKAPNQLTTFQKASILLFGVSNPRPQNRAKPTVSYDTITLESNKETACWFIKNKAKKGTVVLFHGYSGEKSSMLDKAKVFHSLGYSTMLVDFMGSGDSEGNQTTIGFMEAQQVKSCVDFLTENGETNIVLFGTSLGAAAIMKASHDYELPVKSLIIECPFGTMLQTVKNRFSTMGIPAIPMAHLLVFWGGVQNGFNGFSHNPAEYAKSITCRTLLFYGEKDQRVTLEETAAVFQNLAGPKVLVTFPLAGHENYLTKYSDEWTKKVSLFLQEGETLAQNQTAPASTAPAATSTR